MYDTGLKQWETFKGMAPKNSAKLKVCFDKKGQLSMDFPTASKHVFKYIGDPANPVPYRSEIEGLTFTPRKYMTDDQRHASKRADVLTFSSEVLDDPLTIAGEIKAFLKAMTGTDADFVVKSLISVQTTTPTTTTIQKTLKMAVTSNWCVPKSFVGVSEQL